MRKLSFIDQMIHHIDCGLKAVHASSQGTGRAHPAERCVHTELSDSEKKHAAGLMRVNHTGEIAAQALYNGQAIAAKNPRVRERLQQSALEETDHLAWCKQRVEQLGESTSLFGPFWYWGSYSIGVLAGLSGDQLSLGFIKETEDQVGAHLKGHLTSLPENDQRSRAIVEQMIVDEQHHGDVAMSLGGKALPEAVKALMKATSNIMTTVSYRV